MGEIADMVIEGILCEQCGMLFDDLMPNEGDIILNPPGHPRTCSDCEGDD